MKTLIDALSTLPMVPHPTPTPPPGVGALMNMLLGWLMYAGMAASVAGFIVGGITLAIENRNGQASDNMKRLVTVGLATGVIGAAASLVTAILAALA